MEKQKMKKTIKIHFIVTFIVIAVFSLGINVVRAFEEKALTTTVNQEENEIVIQQEIEKYFRIHENGMLLQQKLTVEQKQEDCKKEYEKIETIAPSIQGKKPQSVIVLFENQKMEEPYEYDKQTGLLKIETLHDQKLEEYKIIYHYEEMPDEEKEVKETIECMTKVSIKIVDQEEIQKEDKKVVEIQEMGEAVSLTVENTKELYKGYLYEAKQNETKYMQNSNIEISSIENIAEIRMEHKEENYTFYQEEVRQAFPTNQSVYYIKTQINKENMLKILGQDGIITIKDNNDTILYEITKDTEEDEKGNITVSYEKESVNHLVIVTSKPKTEGTLKIENQKGISANTTYQTEQLKLFQYLEETITANNSMQNTKMALIEPQTHIDLEINKEELSSMIENKDVEIKAILKANNNQDKLLKNPTIQIILPEEIETMKIQEIQLLYEEELKIQNVYLEGKVLTISLEGEQTSYKEQSIEGAVVVMKADLQLNKKITNRIKEFGMTCTDDENKVAEVKKEISLISPREMITVNTIENFGLETIGEEKQEEVGLEINSTAKELKIKSEIINNNGKEIKNVNIIGDMPTNNTTNHNLGATVTTPVTVEGKEVKVYYTNQENASENIEEPENGWTEDSSQIANAKKYLIQIEAMAIDEKVDFSYDISIPEGLDYNRKAQEGYKVLYTNSENEISNRVDSTYINLTTGKGPIVDGTLVAKVGQEKIENGGIVKAGEVVTYEITLTNTGTELAKDVVATMDAPENTTFQKEETGTTTVSTLEVGESKVITYQVRVNDNLDTKTEIRSKAKITYDGFEKETEEIAYNIEPAKIVGEVDWVTNGETMLIGGDMVEYGACITNNTDTTQENLVLEWNLPEDCEIKLQAIKDEQTGLDKAPLLENSKTINLGTLEARKSIAIRLIVLIGNVEESKNIFVSATVKQGEEIYRIGRTEERLVYTTTNYTRKLTANNENEYIKPGEEIVYAIEITNQNDPRIYQIEGQEHKISVKDTIPEGLTVLGVMINGEEQEIDTTNPNEIFLSLSSNPGETKTITIRTIVDYKESQTTNETITNQATMITSNGTELETNSVSHIIDREEGTNGGEDEEPGNDTNSYKISGKVWIDENQDGEMGEEENFVQGIKVTLMDIKTNEYATNLQNQAIETTTNQEGAYTLSNIPEGEYLVVFEYDSSRYTLTQYQKEGVASSRNSKVVSKKLAVGNIEKTYGVTDIIKITNRSIANINMGLVKTQEFDFRLDKYISRIIVQTANSSNVYSYANTSLAKVELDAKKLTNTNITVEYKIKVSNVGQLDGYAKKIADYLPEGFSFNPQQNKDWYKQGENLYNVSLANEKIAVGEAKELTLLLTKNMTPDETGSYINTAEIMESYNEAGITDINSTPGNKVKGENDISEAELLVSIRTGKVLAYMMLLLSSVGIIAIGIYLIKSKVLDTKK